MNYPLKSPSLASKDDLQAKISFPDYTSSQTDEIPSGSVYYVPYPCLIAFTMTSEVDRAFLYSISVNEKIIILETLEAGSQLCNTLVLKGGDKIKWNSDGPVTLAIKIFKLQSI
mgnify:CR=1 FL=1